ncbi:hypothetical protein [Frigoribacterium sp. VKM Ac-2836]|uniref:hypothetical protein n=1 Tax=Frigoribacterium sp. VKM Ac-2836 TaxID=2739014 RepID=UPI001563FB16|nr:hypothetical protein [Frigoribacterium sp. VKM Ac-2836]NRD26219.1 hypothetical protein [Frigoribacterium sp. VKM Ac-2836]
MTYVKYFGWLIPTVIGAVIAISTSIDPWLIGAAVAVVILVVYSGAGMVTQRGMTRAATKAKRQSHHGHARSGR